MGSNILTNKVSSLKSIYLGQKLQKVPSRGLYGFTDLNMI